MATQHTTPEKSSAAAQAHQQRARAATDSRMRRDACYDLYATALQCLDDNGYMQDACQEAFQAFNDCRSTSTAQDGAKKSTWDSMMAAQEKDPLLGFLFRKYNSWRSSSPPQQQPQSAAVAPAAAAEQQEEDDAEPEWKRARRRGEQMQQLQEVLAHKQAQQELMQREEEEWRQKQQQKEASSSRGWWSWLLGRR